jgi:protein gp37
MMGKPLTPEQQNKWTQTGLESLSGVRGAGVKWMSIEPLSFNIAPLIADAPRLDWAVIGAASLGATYHQPDAQWVINLLSVLDRVSTPVFFKGNLDWRPWRNAMPTRWQLPTVPAKPSQPALF